MSTGPDKDSDILSLAQLNARLRLLAGVEPPKALRGKLVAAIPPKATSQVDQSVRQSWPRAVGWGSVAAAAVIVLAAALRLLSPAGRSLPSIADINDRSAMAALADANFPRPRDSNICDSNAL
jgi:hypothetical protein